jgi:hypothetical protein
LAPCGIPDELPLALEPPELEPDEELELPPELEPPDELEPADVVGVDEGDFEADGELPQPATTNATATRATPSQALPDLANVLLMVRGPPSVSVMPTASMLSGR